MADELIYKSAAIDICEVAREVGDGDLRTVAYRISKLSAVDAVEVVRCSECIHRGKDSWCAYVDDDPDFFCKRGRRVTNAADNG